MRGEEREEEGRGEKIEQILLFPNWEDLEARGGKLINIIFNYHNYSPLFSLIPILFLIFSIYFTQTLLFVSLACACKFFLQVIKFLLLLHHLFLFCCKK
jgi:hypothetical protein